MAVVVVVVVDVAVIVAAISHNYQAVIAKL